MGRIKIGILENDIKLSKACNLHFSKNARFEIIFEYSSFNEYTNGYKNLITPVPDILIISDDICESEIVLPIPLMLAQYPLAKIIIFSAKTSIEKILQVFNNGAHGYISTSMPLTFLNTAIDDILAYGKAISPDAAALVLQYTTSKNNHNLYAVLTKREMEIAIAIVDGKSYKELALQLFVSVFTINHHLKNIYRKLEVKSKSELIAILLNNPVTS